MREMNATESKVVEETIRAIYSMNHACRLSIKDAKAMKLKPGRLCDICEDLVKAHMQDIAVSISPQPTVTLPTNEST
jgi:hypothetical protein